MRASVLTISILFLAAVVPAQKSPVTVFLAGDSTAAAKLAEKRPETGWGEMLERFFAGGRVRVENRAANGRSTKTFIGEGRWQSILDDLKKGDYVFVQFGHNDAAREKGERYTPPEDYRKNLIRFIDDVRAKRASLVLLTPVVRRRFDREGKFYDTHGRYPDIARAVAREKKVPLIDMHRKSEKLIDGLGAEESKKLFLILRKGESRNYPDGLDDNTHFNPRGAEEMARLVAEGIRETKIGLRKFLKK